MTATEHLWKKKRQKKNPDFVRHALNFNKLRDVAFRGTLKSVSQLAKKSKRGLLQLRPLFVPSLTQRVRPSVSIARMIYTVGTSSTGDRVGPASERHPFVPESK